MRSVLVPAAVRPGDRIRVIAPSGPFDRALVLRAIGWLGQRYRVEFDWGIFCRDGLCAGPDDRRLAELDAALRSPHLRAVLAARGGHGLVRIVHRAQLTPLLRYPKWLVGFSDITLLHAELAAASIASLHAPNVTALGRADADLRARFIDALEAPTRTRAWGGLEVWSDGAASGVLAGGNLTMLFTWAAAGRLHLPDGCILLLEDVTEQSYRLDRMLSALRLSGALARVAGVVIGELVDCPAGPHGVAAADVVRQRLAGLGVPVLSGLPCGHGARNDPLPLGVPARLDAATRSLVLCPTGSRPLHPYGSRCGSRASTARSTELP